jgi:ferredoxin
MKNLKTIRVIVSAGMLLLFTYVFIAAGLRNALLCHAAATTQLAPDLIELTVKGLAGGGAVFFLLTAVTLLFGRVYCSTLCPLGTVQDAIIRLKAQSSKPRGKRFKYEKSINWIQYIITAVVAGSLFAGSMALLSLLDPYANFGRVAATLAKPAVVFINNVAAYIFGTFEIYAVKPVQMHYTEAGLVIFTAGFFILVAVLSVWKGRIYCNSICPVGGILSLISRVSVFKLKFSREKCTSCGLCEAVCKANCIDGDKKEIDFSRCINCYNCVSACRFGAVSYAMADKGRHDPVRRQAIKILGAAGAGLAMGLLPGGIQAKIDSGLVPQKRMVIPVPPGTGGIKRLTGKCIACHLCVSACPSQVISPSLFENGMEGFLQPRMDYDRSYCNYSCNTCTLVCPTGAISELTVADKRLTKIGTAKFVKKNCVVYTKNAECLVCNEYCPTKACGLVPYKNGLKIPEVNEKTCIGCGACEFMCPARPEKAVYVEGLPVHARADKPAFKKKVWNQGKEFPF